MIIHLLLAAILLCFVAAGISIYWLESRDNKEWETAICSDESSFWLNDAPSIEIHELYVSDVREIMLAVLGEQNVKASKIAY